MSLIDAVREETRQILDVLTRLENTRCALENDRAAGDEKLRSMSADMVSHKDVPKELRARLSRTEAEIKTLEAEIGEIERHRTELLGKRAEFQESQEKLNRSLSEAEDELMRMQQGVNDARQAQNEILNRIQEVEAEKSRRESELLRAARNALGSYLFQEADSLEKTIVAQMSLSRGFTQLGLLTEARQNNHHVGSLCHSRDELKATLKAIGDIPGYRAYLGDDELKRILKTMASPAVKETLEVRLATIESELDKMFPGALAVENSEPPAGVSRKLYYITDEKGRLRLLLPVTMSVWENLSTSTVGEVEDLAIKILWHVAQALHADPRQFRFEIVEDHPELVSTGNLHDLSMPEEIFIPLATGNNLSLNPTPLPKEILEFLDESQIL